MQRKRESYMVLHSDLFVRSMDRALDFYCNKLQFYLIEDTLVRGPLVRELSRGAFDAVRLALIRVSRVGAMIEIQEFQPSSALSKDALDCALQTGLVSILVSDLDAHISRTKEEGLHPSSEIFDVALPRQGNCRVVFYQDHDGNRVEFLQMARLGVDH